MSIIIKKKHCPNNPFHQIISYGKNATGKQRFYCKNCRKVFLWKRLDQKKKQHLEIFRQWVVKGRTAEELSEKYHKSVRQIYRITSRYLSQTKLPNIKSNRPAALVIDGIWFKKTRF